MYNSAIACYGSTAVQPHCYICMYYHACIDNQHTRPYQVQPWVQEWCPLLGLAPVQATQESRQGRVREHRLAKTINPELVFYLTSATDSTHWWKVCIIRSHMIKYCAQKLIWTNCKLCNNSWSDRIQDRCPLLNQRRARECTDRLTDIGRARLDHFKSTRDRWIAQCFLLPKHYYLWSNCSNI